MGDEQTLTDTMCFTQPPAVLVREVGDELVALDTVSEQYFSLSEVGRRCYELLSQGQNVGETTSRIVEEYDATAEQVRADLDALIAGLLDAGLLQPAG